jgi:anti-sigma factor ChrR (cupin superfamily)
MIDQLTCREVASLLTEYLERTISWERRIQTGMHMRRCPGCRKMLDDLEALPGLVSRFEPLLPKELTAAAPALLAAAVERLGHKRTYRLPESSMPPTVRRLLSPLADLPLRLMAQTHMALLQGPSPESEPYLPESILAQLPPEQTWTWRQFPGGIRRAQLLAEANGPTLSLVFMPPNFSLAPHTHFGSESLLVLEGELEQADQCLSRGDWIHMESGSSHAPCAYGRGCWCLARDEGSIHFASPFGWGRSLMAGA